MTARLSIDNRSRRRASGGFTLVEVLIAIALLALLSVMILGALRLGVRAWERGDAAYTGVEDVSFAQLILRRSLEEAYPQLVRGESATVIDFNGSETGVSFLGPAPQSLRPAGRARIVVRSVADGESVTLVIEIRPELANPENNGAVIVEPLIEGLESVKFSYLPLGESGWRSAWTNETRLPALVKIEAEITGGGRVWPTLIIAPRIGVDVACRYDPLTKYCQGRRR